MTLTTKTYASEFAQIFGQLELPASGSKDFGLSKGPTSDSIGACVLSITTIDMDASGKKSDSEGEFVIFS